MNSARPFLSYSTNVHPAESAAELMAVLREHVAPISRAAFGPETAAVNLRLGMRQADELLGNPTLPSTSMLPDTVLQAGPAPACAALLGLLDELNLDVVSVNAFPIRDFHAPRVKEQVYSPPWTDGGRVLYSLKIAKVLTHFMKREDAAISVPTGVFKGLYPDTEEVRGQCAHFLTECVRELLRLERLTGRTVRLGLEPEPLTTGETLAEFLDYYTLILKDAREKFPRQLGVTRARAEEIVRRFVTINLDLCHQAVEFEDSVADLKALQAAGIGVSGLHLSAAVKVAEPGRNPEAFAQFSALDEPRYLHQVVARLRNGELARFADLPELRDPRRLKGRVLDDFAELRCHFHVPLFAAYPPESAFNTTRDAVAPAVRYALEHGLTGNFVVETYTWNVLAALAQMGNAAARNVTGERGGADVHAGIVRELGWAKSIFVE